MKQQRKRIGPNGDACMSFEEIAAELGMTRGGVLMTYKRAMRKLTGRRHRRQLEELRSLAASKGRGV